MAWINLLVAKIVPEGRWSISIHVETVAALGLALLLQALQAALPGLDSIVGYVEWHLSNVFSDVHSLPYNSRKLKSFSKPHVHSLPYNSRKLKSFSKPHVHFLPYNSTKLKSFSKPHVHSLPYNSRKLKSFSKPHVHFLPYNSRKLKLNSKQRLGAADVGEWDIIILSATAYIALQGVHLLVKQILLSGDVRDPVSPIQTMSNIATIMLANTFARAVMNYIQVR